MITSIVALRIPSSLVIPTSVITPPSITWYCIQHKDASNMSELWVSVMGTFEKTITTIPDPITYLLFWLPPSCDCAIVVAVCLISYDRNVGDYHMELCFIVRILHTSMRGIYQYLFNRGCLTQSGYFGHRMPMKTNCHRGYTTIIHFQLPVTHGASICYIMTTWHGNVFALCPFCEGNRRWLADSSHKGQVMQSVDDA